MYADGFKEILDKFVPTFDCIKSLCRKLRSIIFPLLKNRKLDLKTLADLSTLYKPIINVFKDAITDLNTDT